MGQSPFTIRLAQPGDYEAVGRITYAAYSALEGYVEEAGYTEVLLDVAGRAAAAEVFVISEGGRVLGAMTYVPDGENALSEWDEKDAAGMRMLAIDPSLQGKGAGRAMTEFALERARAAGRSMFILHSASFMTRAHGLYESLGFTRYPEIDFAVEPVTLWGYRLTL